ncbi:major facilitator transporter [Hyphomonas polymorpha PS728]|uniref:Major facilitator transporter n=1 Tax=Hyphomonas polymorpha PS728 TaxID=1280954 RepID=A0A062VBZ5_9PROT|nr:MFS transporter [Hyphomonas polymorpha]KCZ96842.1 major facilitator transporter [Hyphomonas polymorpha PS728]
MVETAQATAVSAGPVTPATPLQKTLALVILMAIGSINYVDRQLLSLLIEPVRQDIPLSDTAFGLLTGLFFALFYASMGVPVAMLADRINRVKLVAVACTMWSVCTGLCGFAQNFWQLALARFGVGVGEAGGTAPSLSILSDYFKPEQRPAIIGLYTVNGPIGVFIGISLGGFIAAQYGWRMAFFTVAILGIALAPILWLLVREPLRGATEAAAPSSAHEKAPSLLSTIRIFLMLPTLRLLLPASGLLAFVSYGLLNWIPAFLMRENGMALEQLALWFGPAAGVCMGLGIWGGGAIVNIGVKKSLTAYAWAPAFSVMIGCPFLLLALFMPGWELTLILLLIPMVSVVMYVAPALALTQNLAPLRARATATALLLLSFNLVGIGGGPLMIGILSDLFTSLGSQNSLRWALASTIPVSLLAMGLYIMMARTITSDHETRRIQTGI